MQRDAERLNKSLEFHRKLQEDLFLKEKSKLLTLARFYHREKNDLEKYQQVWDKISKMKFQFDKSAVKINYGFCSKLSKEVSFIPNHCQLETQECFKHRKST